MKRLKGRLNENFFKNPTIINSYWAGFIAADGCIHFNKDRKYYSLTLGLAEKDKNHILKFKKAINTNYSIGNTIVNGHKVARLSMYRVNNLVKHLDNNFNITPRKSLTLKYPKKLKIKDRISFIIGYIDGDGSIFYTKKTTYLHKSGNLNNVSPQLVLSILGTKSFLTELKKDFEFLAKITLKNVKVRKTDSKAYSLRLNTKNALTLLKLLYKVKVPKLKRKWHKIQEFQEMLNGK